MAFGLRRAKVYIYIIVRAISFRDFQSGGLRKTIFSARLRLGRSTSSKVIGFSTNRKRVCDFLLVRHSNFGPIRTVSEILQVSAQKLTSPLFHPNFGGVPVAPDRPCFGQPAYKP